MLVSLQALCFKRLKLTFKANAILHSMTIQLWYSCQITVLIFPMGRSDALSQAAPATCNCGPQRQVSCHYMQLQFSSDFDTSGRKSQPDSGLSGTESDSDADSVSATESAETIKLFPASPTGSISSKTSSPGSSPVARELQFSRQSTPVSPSSDSRCRCSYILRKRRSPPKNLKR